MRSLKQILSHRKQYYLFLSHYNTLFTHNEKYDIKKLLRTILSTNKQYISRPIKMQTNNKTNDEIEEKEEILITKKGHGGGKNTNREGKGFEALTDNVPHLLEQGFEKEIWNKTSKHGFTLRKIFYGGLDNLAGDRGGAIEDISLGGKQVVYLSQGGFKAYMQKHYELKFPRNPDEAYLVLYSSGRRVMKILEKKAQSVEGSADTKLMAADAFRQEYLFFSEGKFEVEYAFCLSRFFQEKFSSTATKKNRKYLFLKQLLKREGIEVFFGEDSDYFDKLRQWIQCDVSANHSIATLPPLINNSSQALDCL